MLCWLKGANIVVLIVLKVLIDYIPNIGESIDKMLNHYV